MLWQASAHLDKRCGKVFLFLCHLPCSSSLRSGPSPPPPPVTRCTFPHPWVHAVPSIWNPLCSHHHPSSPVPVIALPVQVPRDFEVHTAGTEIACTLQRGREGCVKQPTPQAPPSTMYRGQAVHAAPCTVCRQQSEPQQMASRASHTRCFRCRILNSPTSPATSCPAPPCVRRLIRSWRLVSGRLRRLAWHFSGQLGLCFLILSSQSGMRLQTDSQSCQSSEAFSEKQAR